MALNPRQTDVRQTARLREAVKTYYVTDAQHQIGTQSGVACLDAGLSRRGDRPSVSASDRTHLAEPWQSFLTGMATEGANKTRYVWCVG